MAHIVVIGAGLGGLPTAYELREQGAEITLTIAMAYILQVQAAAWCVKLTDRIFGPAEQALTQTV